MKNPCLSPTHSGKRKERTAYSRIAEMGRAHPAFGVVMSMKECGK